MQHDTRQRIVFGINGLTMGGAEKQLMRLVPNFDEDRFEIHLITLFAFPKEHELYDEIPPHVSVHRLSFKGALDVWSWWRTYLLLRKIRPHVVVSSFFFSNTVFRVLQPLVGYVSLAREHNTYVDKPRLHQIIDRILAQRSCRIVAVSEEVADFTARQEGIPRERFTVINNGIDLEETDRLLEALPSKEALRSELGFMRGETVFLNVARLVPQKNHALLLEGFARFHHEHPASRLAIVGDGPLRSALEVHAERLGIRKAVSFLGLKPQTWGLYKASDIVVSTSTIEGFSNVYLEALATGLSLLATKTAGTCELVEEGKNGFFLDADPDAIATALARAAREDLGVLGEYARRSVERFDIRRTAERYEELFTDCTPL